MAEKKDPPYFMYFPGNYRWSARLNILFSLVAFGFAATLFWHRGVPGPYLMVDDLNVVFIGHVDAGKSTTGGQILFLTGGVDDRTIAKYEKEAKDKNRESW